MPKVKKEEFERLISPLAMGFESHPTHLKIRHADVFIGVTIEVFYQSSSTNLLQEKTQTQNTTIEQTPVNPQ
jgi:hypothetical protein